MVRECGGNSKTFDPRRLSPRGGLQTDEGSAFEFFYPLCEIGPCLASASSSAKAVSARRQSRRRTRCIRPLGTNNSVCCCFPPIPAHSLADVLQVKLSDRVKRLPATGHVCARQIDPDRQIHKFLAHERDDILALLNKGSLFTRDELAPLLDTSLPGMAEVAALLAIHELLDSDYDEVVVDTAPMGHAIRLFQMPDHFARFLDVLEAAASRDVVLAQHFGGHVQREPALDRWARMVERVEKALSVAGSKLVLVTTPEPFSLNEAARSAAAFQNDPAQTRIAEIVLNRAVQGKTSCPHCRRRVKQIDKARQFLRREFPQAKVFTAEDPGCPILAVPALRAFGAHIFEARKLPLSVLAKWTPYRPGRAGLQAGVPTVNSSAPHTHSTARTRR